MAEVVAVFDGPWDVAAGIIVVADLHGELLGSDQCDGSTAFGRVRVAAHVEQAECSGVGAIRGQGHGEEVGFADEAGPTTNAEELLVATS